MSRLSLTGLLLVGMLLFGVSQTAQAVLVTADGEQLFYDGFEDDTPADAGGGGDADPMKWTVTEDWDTANQVLSAVHQQTYLPSGPAEGDQYYKIYAPQGTGNYSRAPLSRTTTADDEHVHVEWMMYIPETLPGGATPEWLGFFDLSYQSAGNGWQGRTWNGLRTTTDTVWNYDGAWNDTGLAWATDTWQKWELDFYPQTVSPYNGTYTVTIDGASTGSMEQLDTSGYAARYFFFNGGSAGSFYTVDAVPEPTTLALLGLGGLALVGRRRK